MGSITSRSRSANKHLPLSCAAVRRAGLGELRHAVTTGSTNDDLAQEARLGERSPAVLVADHQTAGRGRLGRRWSDAATGPHAGEASLLVSFRLEAPLEAERIGERFRPIRARPWPERPVSAANKSGSDTAATRRSPAYPRSLLAGAFDRTAAVSAAALLAVSGTLAGSGAAVRAKWPNDLLIEGQDPSGKVAGVLSQIVDGDPPVVVVGLGLNIAAAPPEPGAVSLAQAGGAATRDEILASLIDALPGYLADPGRAREDLRVASATLGSEVRVQRTDGTSIVGTAVDIDGSGRLVVAGDSGEVAIDAGDVFHLRS